VVGGGRHWSSGRRCGLGILERNRGL
jgi:hypothetical protein